jgi:hypothetical protein
VAKANKHIKIVRCRSLGRRKLRGAPYVKRYALEKREETIMRLWSTRIISTTFPVPNL